MGNEGRRVVVTRTQLMLVDAWLVLSDLTMLTWRSDMGLLAVVRQGCIGYEESRCMKKKRIFWAEICAFLYLVG